MKGIPDMNFAKNTFLAGSLATLAMTSVTAWTSEAVTRVPFNFATPTGISTSVSVPATMKLHFISGQLPTIADPKNPGDTYTQTKSVIGKLVAQLAALGLKPSDAVKGTVFLVGDPNKGGEQDFAGFSRAWTETWNGGPGGDFPARSAVKIAGLNLPGALVEIELIAAGPAN
jgi:enamine deaminase RidA (YjgF/YER057c/UK114 family)